MGDKTKTEGLGLDYLRGLEDSLELCSSFLDGQNDLAKIKEQIKYHLVCVKERKWERLRFLLGVFR